MEGGESVPSLIKTNMTMETGRLLKKGFTPLTANRFAAISWQGEGLREFWMWNGQLMKGPDGTFIQTVKVADLKEAALRYWRDGWVPLKWDRALLGRLEESLRQHSGLKGQGAVFPDGPFLNEPGEIPSEHLTPALKKFISGGRLV